jgi:hypothetical protein
MGGQAMFNLNDEIAVWRKSILETETCTESDVNELESHLKEEIDQLKTKELSEQEAFLVAASRIGKPVELAGEFAKINQSLIFRNRIFWICIGMLSFIIITALAITTSAATAFIATFTKLNNYDMALGTIVAICQVGVFIAIAFLFCITIKNDRKPKLSTFFKTKTRGGSVIFFTVLLYTAILALSFFFIFQTIDASDSGMFSGVSRMIVIVDFYLITCFIITPLFLAVALIKFRPNNNRRPSHV